MERKIIETGDGSHTIAIPAQHITYHSLHGAIQESKHVFIEAGLHFIQQQIYPPVLYVFEMGFGTGLNALLTAMEAQKTETHIYYTTVETDPLTQEEINQLNYNSILNSDEHIFRQIHQCKWNEAVYINNFFTLQKENISLVNFATDQRFHLIYYDAFAPAAQPELWTLTVFQKLYNMLQPGGVLVTYCSKGDVRRAMTAAGFSVQKLQGPPGKREMVRARKSL